jgi:methionyl-tRNA formyltransferase
MKKISETITFFGSGPVAARSLELLKEYLEIEAVVTKPRPAHHRGEFPVVELAKKLGLRTFTPKDKQELSTLFTTKPASSKIGIVIDYGIIIPKSVIDYFPLGIVNSHFSLLPEWRGADPISFSVLSGQQKTGVSLMLIDEGLDTGKLITQKSIGIKPGTTAPSLTEELIKLSVELIEEYLPKYLDGSVIPHSQPHPDRATYSRKLTKAEGVIDWSKPARQIEQEIRAYIEWPKSRTMLWGMDVIITSAHLLDKDGEPGTAVSEGKQLFVYCGEKALAIDRLKPAGKNEMTSEAFIAGHKSSDK